MVDFSIDLVYYYLSSMASNIALKPAHVSCPVGRIWSSGSSQLNSPVSLSSMVNTYGMFMAPYAQSRDVPEDASEGHHNIYIYIQGWVLNISCIGKYTGHSDSCTGIHILVY